MWKAARALVQQLKVLLLDEPTSNLDPKNQYEMLALVRQIAREQGITVLIVIHDLNLALRYCDRFYFLKDRQGYSYGGIETITEETLHNVYGIRAEVATMKEKKVIVMDERSFLNMKQLRTWEDCAAFHGHVCGGLTIGYKVALYAIELLGLEFSDDEQVVCISENDACGVDAIQVMLGCSIGKGNLLFHMRGKQAFSFYNRKTGKSVRLVLKPKPHDMAREESFAFYQSCEPKDMFDVKEATIQLPEKARLFDSYTCECCGESTGANWIRLAGGRKLCLDCYEAYDRFNI